MGNATAVEIEEPQALRALDLTSEQLALLTKQGAVCADMRGGRKYFKLRFRQQGRQVVRYLGKDPDRAARVARELAAMQAAHRNWQACRKARRDYRVRLRRAKYEMQPLLQQLGLKFHGYQVRRPRLEEREETPS